MHINNGMFSSSPDFHPKYYFIILSLFMGFWLTSLIGAIKIVNFFGITLTGGFFTFPLATALLIVIVDIYGYKYGRQAIWCVIFLSLTYLISIEFINLIPSSVEWTLNNEFNKILIPQIRIIIASIFSFSISGILNNYLMAKLKFQGKTLTFRILISAFISINIDITLFFLISFLGVIPFKLLATIFFWAYIKKIICEILLLPFIWAFIEFLKKKEGFEIYDIDTDFSFLSFDNVYDISAYRKINTNFSSPINKKYIK